MTTATIDGRASASRGLDRLDKEAIRAAVGDRAVELLTSIGVPADSLTGRHGPCPKCQGTDRFRLVDAKAGAMFCSKCLSSKNGDFYAGISWWLNCDFQEALTIAAEFAGVSAPRKQHAVATKQAASTNGSQAKPSPHREEAAPTQEIAAPMLSFREVCESRGMPAESARVFGAKPTRWGGIPVVEFPMHGPDGGKCSRFAIPVGGGKGLNEKGKSAGVFLPHTDDGKPIVPRVGEHWLICEGAKDAAALHGLGFSAVGLPTSSLNSRFAKLFFDVHAVVVPDNDHAGQEGAVKTANALAGIAASVKIARLAGVITDSHGLDVRDVLRQPDGQALVREAIDSAVDASEVQPPQSPPKEASADSQRLISNFEMVEESGADGEPKKSSTPLPMAKIIEDIFRLNGGYPRRVGDMLFIDDGGRIDYFDRRTVSGLFGWLRGRCEVRWSQGGDYATQAETFAEVERTARRYDAIELIPHEPPIDGIYYRGQAPPAGDGSHLRHLLDRFRPATTIDRDLIQAAFMTAIWGGPPGCRPAFVVTSDQGRGVGKTKLVEMIGQLAGGAIDVSSNEDFSAVKTRLLTPDARTKRVALIDNLKSLRFSSAELEAMVTAPTISGRQLYVGESRRPNTMVWCITANGASLSTDLSQRSVIIKLAKGENIGTWYEETIAFIAKHRQELIGDIIGAIRGPQFPLDEHSRWATWERDILCRLPDPAEAQRVILERQAETNAEFDEAEIIEEYFAGRLEHYGYCPQTAQVRIPVATAAYWLGKAVGEAMKTAAASKRLHQMANEGQLKRISRDSSRTYGRNLVWTGVSADIIHTPIDNGLAKLIAEELSQELGDR